MPKKPDPEVHDELATAMATADDGERIYHVQLTKAAPVKFVTGAASPDKATAAVSASLGGESRLVTKAEEQAAWRASLRNGTPDTEVNDAGTDAKTAGVAGN